MVLRSSVGDEFVDEFLWTWLRIKFMNIRIVDNKFRMVLLSWRYFIFLTKYFNTFSCFYIKIAEGKEGAIFVSALHIFWYCFASNLLFGPPFESVLSTFTESSWSGSRNKLDATNENSAMKIRELKLRLKYIFNKTSKMFAHKTFEWRTH